MPTAKRKRTINRKAKDRKTMSANAPQMQAPRGYANRASDNRVVASPQQPSTPPPLGPSNASAAATEVIETAIKLRERLSALLGYLRDENFPSFESGPTTGTFITSRMERTMHALGQSHEFVTGIANYLGLEV